MFNLIKEIASKMSKLEVENKRAARDNQNEVNRNQAPFKRPFQPQKILQRPRRNFDDQNVQPPLNIFVEDEQQGNEEINLVGETSQSTCLTFQEYEDRSRICLFSDDMNAQIYAKNDKKQQEVQNRNYPLRSKGLVQQPQLKSNLDKQATKQKAKVNEVPPPQNSAPFLKITTKRNQFQFISVSNLN